MIKSFGYSLFPICNFRLLYKHQKGSNHFYLHGVLKSFETKLNQSPIQGNLGKENATLWLSEREPCFRSEAEAI